MDWQIKTLSKKSSQSGAELKAGDAVVCVVFLNEAGELDRRDFLKSEFEGRPFGGKYIGKWERVVSENPEEDERQARRMAIAGSEDFFISLYDDEAVEVEQKDVLKQMLALLLERRRILRAKGRPEGGFQLYVHSSSKREFLVPQKELNEELISSIQTQIDAFLV
ncbi:MAG: hypothetical protein J6T16_01500 [Opitutales bacterium]|nr:hypothetical protein [Opitutales bacterium]